MGDNRDTASYQDADYDWANPTKPPGLVLGFGFSNPPKPKPIPAWFIKLGIAAERRRQRERLAAFHAALRRRRHLVGRLRQRHHQRRGSLVARSRDVPNRTGSSDPGGDGDGDDDPPPSPDEQLLALVWPRPSPPLQQLYATCVVGQATGGRR
jgi:hypothetical protein